MSDVNLPIPEAVTSEQLLEVLRVLGFDADGSCYFVEAMRLTAHEVEADIWQRGHKAAITVKVPVASYGGAE